MRMMSRKEEFSTLDIQDLKESTSRMNKCKMPFFSGINLILFRMYWYGFILMAKGNAIELYHPQQNVIQSWIEKLKDNVVLVDLREDYHIGSLIGKGNFAKVHLCKRKLDDRTFALKSVEKALIKKSKRNSVSYFQLYL